MPEKGLMSPMSDLAFGLLAFHIDVVNFSVDFDSLHVKVFLELFKSEVGCEVARPFADAELLLLLFILVLFRSDVLVLFGRDVLVLFGSNVFILFRFYFIIVLFRTHFIS